MIKLKLTNPGCGVKFRFACNQIKFNVGQVKGPVVPHVGGVGPAGVAGVDGKDGSRGIPGPAGRGISTGSGGGGASTFLELSDTPTRYPADSRVVDPITLGVGNMVEIKRNNSGAPQGLQFTDEVKAGTF